MVNWKHKNSIILHKLFVIFIKESVAKFMLALITSHYIKLKIFIILIDLKIYIAQILFL
jgi:hypothetical protein